MCHPEYQTNPFVYACCESYAGSKCVPHISSTNARMVDLRGDVAIVNGLVWPVMQSRSPVSDCAVALGFFGVRVVHTVLFIL